MSLTTQSADLNLTKQWFDYTPEMNDILNVLHKRIFNLEIALQANNQISNRSHTHTIIDNNLSSSKIKQNQFSKELTPNSIDTISQRSARKSLISDQYLTLEKQLDKLNLSSHVSLEPITISSIDSPDRFFSGISSPSISSSINLTPNQMKTRAYEFAAIFEDAFDQLNIIRNSYNLSQNNNRLDDIDSNNCNPIALSLAGIFIMNEVDEIEYFFRLLMLFFRALLLDSDSSINKTPNHLSSGELIDLKNRLKFSQEKISKLSFIKKHFHTEKSDQLNILDSTKDHFMEEKFRSKIALRYCNDWKKNHILQWIQMLLQIEQDYTKTIHQYELNLKQTKITHDETVKSLIEQKNQMKANANQWYEHYQNETSRFERELADFRYEFNQIKRQRQDMYEEYQRMKIIVEEYNQMKINERLIFDKQKQEEEAIKRIQAWWRGTMIRRINIPKN